MHDKRVCPNCGHQLPQRPYLMARGDELVWTPFLRTLAVIALGVVILAGVIHTLHP